MVVERRTGPGAENVRLLTDPGHVYATVVGFSVSGDELARYLVEQYPTAYDSGLYQPQGLSNVETPTEHGAGFFSGTYRVAIASVDLAPRHKVDRRRVQIPGFFNAIDGRGCLA
jgi:hypothetical protein